MAMIGQVVLGTGMAALGYLIKSVDKNIQKLMDKQGEHTTRLAVLEVKVAGLERGYPQRP